MKFVAINGSPHGLKGNTGKLLTSFIAAAEDQGAKVQTFNLHEYSIHPCRGCEVCSKTGTCAIRDDVAEIQDAMRGSDGIILASPNYMMNVSGQMKVFLDRIFSNVHCQTMFGKHGAVVVTAAGPVYECVENYLLDILGFLGCWKVCSTGAAALQMEDPEECERLVEEAAQQGRVFASAVKAGTTYPEQEEKRQMVFDMMQMMVQARKDAWAYEYSYWKSRWGIDTD